MCEFNDMSGKYPTETADLSGLGGVLTLRLGPYPGVHGQTIGADGAGDFVFLIFGTPDQAETEAKRIAKTSGRRIVSYVFVPNDLNGSWGGNPLRVVKAL